MSKINVNWLNLAKLFLKILKKSYFNAFTLLYLLIYGLLMVVGNRNTISGNRNKLLWVVGNWDMSTNYQPLKRPDQFLKNRYENVKNENNTIFYKVFSNILIF